MIEITLPPGFSHDEYWVYDSNENKVSYGHHRASAQALAMLQTLTRCTNCTDCADCTDCKDCDRCFRCHRCTNCMDCYSCNDCVNSANSLMCHSCTSIQDSTHCDDCHNCSGLSCEYKSTAVIEHIQHNHEWNIMLHRDGILRIGCKRFPIDAWLKFTDYRIREMAVDALPFWKRWKPTVQMWYDHHFAPSKAQAEQSLVTPE